MPGFEAFCKVALHFPPCSYFNLSSFNRYHSCNWNTKPQALGEVIMHICNDGLKLIYLIDMFHFTVLGANFRCNLHSLPCTLFIACTVHMFYIVYIVFPFDFEIGFCVVIETFWSWGCYYLLPIAQWFSTWGSRPQRGREPFLEGSRVDFMYTAYYICFIRVLYGAGWVIVSCCNGSRYKRRVKNTAIHWWNV